MFKIVNKQVLSKDIKRLDVLAESIACSVQPGQFVMVIPHEKGEGVALSVVECDPRRGIISLIIQETGEETEQLGGMRIHDTIFSVAGPFGNPARLKTSGIVICVATGIGIAQILPVCRDFKKAGNKVIGVIGAKTKRSLVLETQMRIVCDKIFIVTDDGSYERKGRVTDSLKELLDKKTADMVYAVGSVAMMQAVCQMTQQKGIKTLVQASPPMVCGRGICGSCRCIIDGKTVLSCVQGPEFDGHTVDFEDLKIRLGIPPIEKTAAKRQEWKESPGLSKRQILTEAQRCPQCGDAPCVGGCPLGIDIPEFIRFLREGDIAGALKKIKEQNDLPGICGRLCPAPCEDICVLKEKEKTIKVRDLERYAADHGEKSFFGRKMIGLEAAKASGKKVAVIGSGPAGLTAAAQLTRKGYGVTVFESLPAVGGVLRYGTPEFRLPSHVLGGYVDEMKSAGVDFKVNFHIGQVTALGEILEQGFSSILVAVGAGQPRFSDLPGAHLGGIYYAHEILMRLNFARPMTPKQHIPLNIGQKIAVIGKGRAALECARACARLGKEVSVVFPETGEDGQSARPEGVQFEGLTRPLSFEQGENGLVRGVKCERMDFADPDASGAWRLIAVPDSAFTLEADTVILAVGNEPNTSFLQKWTDLKINEDGSIWVDEETGMTSLPAVFATGGVVTGDCSLIDAMVSGKKAAHHMDSFINGVNSR